MSATVGATWWSDDTGCGNACATGCVRIAAKAMSSATITDTVTAATTRIPIVHGRMCFYTVGICARQKKMNALHSWPLPPPQRVSAAPSKQIIIDAPHGYVCVAGSDAYGNIVISFQQDVEMQQQQPPPQFSAPVNAFSFAR